MLRLGSGRRLGITIEDSTISWPSTSASRKASLVKSVQADSAAQKAGIKAGDVITGDQRPKVYDPSDVNRALERIENSGEFTVEMVRDKKTADVEGKVEARETRPRPRVRTIV